MNEEPRRIFPEPWLEQADRALYVLVAVLLPATGRRLWGQGGPARVTGTVTSAIDGSPLQGTRVTVKGTTTTTLTATNGTITLAGTNGLGFTIGDGTDDTTMTFTGSVSEINQAMEGMSFRSFANITGSEQRQRSQRDWKKSRGV